MEFHNSCDGFYKNSLDVRLTKNCDNDCPFCIEKTGLLPKQESVWDMLTSTIKAINVDGKTDILILGGEPLLRIHQLNQYLSKLRSLESRKALCTKPKVYVTTSLPRVAYYQTVPFYDIIDKIDGLNVSLQHYDWQENNNIMMASDIGFNRIDFLKSILNHGDVANKVRVSINLVQGQIDSKAKLMYFLEMLKGMGCKHVKINELQHSPNLYVSFERVMGVHLGSPYSHGCQKDIDIIDGMRVTLKRSCFLVEPSHYATFSDLVKATTKRLLPKMFNSSQLVMYENGELSNGWQTR